MRGYALFIGMVLTLAQYGTIERAATSSVPGVRVRPKALDVVWYGGTLDPVVVEATVAKGGARTQRLGVAHRTSGREIARVCEDGRLNPSIER